MLRPELCAEVTGSVLVMVGDLPEPIGGIGEHCFSVCEALADRGVHVHFLDTEPNPRKRLPRLASYAIVTENRAQSCLALARSPRVLVQFVRVFRRVVPALGLRGTVGCLLMAARIAGTLRASKALAVAAHHAGTRGLSAMLAARATGARLTVFVHGAEWGHEGWRRLEPVTTLVAREADAVIAGSRFTADLCTAGSGRTAVDVIHPGVDHGRFHPGTPSSRSAEVLTVLFVGQLHARKGPVVLARAIPFVGADRAVRYVFAGPDRGEADAVRRAIADDGVENLVQICGPVAAEDLADLYRSADVVVFPTVWPTEGFGLVAAEAMACGTPVVASRIAAIPEVVLDGVTGRLFTPGDARDLAEKLSSLLRDEPLRHRLGAAGEVRARSFQWSAFVDPLCAGRTFSA